MVYKLTKLDEGQYFLIDQVLETGTYLQLCYYIVKVDKIAIAYRTRFYVRGMFGGSFWNDKRRRKFKAWKFQISRADDACVFPDNMAQSYPLDLSIMDEDFKSPSDHLTKKQKQALVDFESQIKD